MIYSIITAEIKNALAYPKNQIALGLTLLVVCGAGSWYYIHAARRSKDYAAQRALSTAFADFNQALQATSSWEDVSVIADIQYRRTPNSWASPYLLALQAYSLEQDTKIAEALALWTTIIAAINKDHPLWYVFQTKFTLLKLCQPNSAHTADTLVSLRALADDAHNIYRDQALYFLGFFDEQAWATLLQEFGNTNSAWAALKKAASGITAIA